MQVQATTCYVRELKQRKVGTSAVTISETMRAWVMYMKEDTRALGTGQPPLGGHQSPSEGWGGDVRGH